MTSGSKQPEEAALLHLSPVKPGERLDGKYLIGAELGRGGMGIVVEARDEFLARPVAIKFMAPRLAWSDVSVHRFMQEARAVASLESEHVVDMREFGRLPSGIPYFVMEYLAGLDLKALLAKQGPLGTALAVDYVLQALHAVTEGHTKGIVHRDLKPGNLFLHQRADGTSLIKVLDFGIAKTLRDEHVEHDTALTASGELRLGSPPYMSPEQLQAPRDVDARSDIWSLGVTLYELLTDRLPFTGSNQFELLNNLVGADRAPILEQLSAKGVPSAVVGIVERCLQPKPAERYSSAVELAAALAPFGNDDSRSALRRILGLATPPREVTERDAGERTSLKACTTTLPVPVALGAGRVVGPPARAARRKASVVVGAGIVLALGTWLALRQNPSGTPLSNVSTVGSAAPVVSTAAVVAPTTTLVAAERSVETRVAAADTTSRANAAELTAGAVARRPAEASMASKRSESRVGAPGATVPSTTAAAASAPAPASASPAAGGHDIEALIQRRR